MTPEEKKLKALRERAEAGDSKAEYELGLMYYRGDGVPQDMTAARAWLTKAAEQGQRDAQVLLNLRGMRLNQGVEFKLGSRGKASAKRRGGAEEVAEGAGGGGASEDRNLGPPKDKFESVGRIADAIEAELRAIRFWSDEPPTAEMMEFRQAFAMDTMPLAMWVQFVLLPRIRSIIAERGQFPASSSVGAHAVREFDGQREASNLVSLLSELDEAVTRG